MVQRRLEHEIGHLHPQLFAYTSGVGTTENIAGLLSTIKYHPTIVVFLDLEKAFELVNPPTILEALTHKGVQERLPQWIRDYIMECKAYATLQGKDFQRHLFENGTPQRGLLSPLLFNIVMEQLVSLEFTRGVKLVCYADDLQLIVQ